MHAAMEFANAEPAACQKWYKNSNSVIVLAAEDDRKLFELSRRLRKKGLNTVEFYEPDIGYELTAIAIEPGPLTKRLCSGLRLAGKREHPEAKALLSKKFDAIDAMRSCCQSAGQNMLQHGESVHAHLKDLIGVLQGQEGAFQWRLPEWTTQYSSQLLERLPDPYTLQQYAIWHDCGKPLTRTQDEEGKVHYPEHAKASAELFRSLYPGREDVARLIEMDMDMHRLKSPEIEEFSQRKEAPTLLLSALAEVHSNAAMFGGVGSDSCKIKLKHLEKKGMAVCRKIFG